MVIDLDGVFVNKFCRTHNTLVGRPLFYIADYKTDKTVAFGLHAVHDFFAVYRYAVFIQMHAKRIGMQSMMARFRSRNQQFGRHTADTRTSCSEYIVFNQVNIVCLKSGIAKCAHTGCTATQYYHICLNLFHILSLLSISKPILPSGYPFSDGLNFTNYQNLKINSQYLNIDLKQ